MNNRKNVASGYWHGRDVFLYPLNWSRLQVDDTHFLLVDIIEGVFLEL